MATALLGGVIGILMGVLAMWAMRPSTDRPDSEDARPANTLPSGLDSLLTVLSSSGVVLDAGDHVVKSSPSAHAQGLVRGDELVHPELRKLSRQVRRDREIRGAELALPRGPLGHGRSFVKARVAPLDDGHVILLIDDLTQSRRVDEVRRDFIANVSHELKTPVGGLRLLAEAVEEAHDDPRAVVRFAGRMRTEAERLGQLVQEIIDLSRLQSEQGQFAPVLIDLAKAANDALDRTRIAAESKHIDLISIIEPELAVYGDHELLVTAIGNLLRNAVNYSDSRTRVTLTTKVAGEFVEIAVSDNGLGIPLEDQERVFERFYRVDSARSRATGGTGLGLAIVKHISENHGGTVTVWSKPHYGSTFTIRLPNANPTEGARP